MYVLLFFGCDKMPLGVNPIHREKEDRWQKREVAGHTAVTIKKQKVNRKLELGWRKQVLKHMSL